MQASTLAPHAPFINGLADTWCSCCGAWTEAVVRNRIITCTECQTTALAVPVFYVPGERPTFHMHTRACELPHAGVIFYDGEGKAHNR